MLAGASGTAETPSKLKVATPIDSVTLSSFSPSFPSEIRKYSGCLDTVAFFRRCSPSDSSEIDIETGFISLTAPELPSESAMFVFPPDAVFAQRTTSGVVVKFVK